MSLKFTTIFIIQAKDRCTGIDIDGRRIRVDYSITRRAHTPTPGIYLGKATEYDIWYIWLTIVFINKSNLHTLLCSDLLPRVLVLWLKLLWLMMWRYTFDNTLKRVFDIMIINQEYVLLKLGRDRNRGVNRKELLSVFVFNNQVSSSEMFLQLISDFEITAFWSSLG